MSKHPRPQRSQRNTRQLPPLAQTCQLVQAPSALMGTVSLTFNAMAGNDVSFTVGGAATEDVAPLKAQFQRTPTGDQPTGLTIIPGELALTFGTAVNSGDTITVTDAPLSSTDSAQRRVGAQVVVLP